MLRSIYYAFFQSHMSYNILNWSCASQNSLKSIASSQNKAIRITFRDFTLNTDDLYNTYKILPLTELIKLEQGKLMWKVLNNQMPDIITNIFVTHQNRPQRQNRRFIPIFRTKKKESFLSNTAKLNWTTIPEELQNKSTIQTFSKNYYKFLLSN